jgi:hypothetical protein
MDITMQEELQPDVVIMTTCIDRPELHDISFKSYKRYLNGVNCKWIFTINNLTNNIDRTVKNIQALLPEYDIHIKSFNEGGTRVHWFESAKYCINLAYEFKPKLAYIWLEDDWFYNGNDTVFQHLSMLSDMTNISLHNRDVLSFNPSIWSIDLFEQCMFKCINDPSNRLCLYQFNRDRYNAERIACPNDGNALVKTHHRLSGFNDIGRDWQATNINKRTYNAYE